MKQFRQQREVVIAQISTEVNKLTIRLEKVLENFEWLLELLAVVVDEIDICRKQ